MNATHRQPQHASYRRHRSQVAWQILLPVILAGLLLIVAAYLIWVGTFQRGGDVDRWAAISTIWLTLPVMLGALVMLALLIGLAYLVGRASGFIPPYTLQAQLFTSKIVTAAHRVEQIGYRPTLIFGELGRLLRTAFRRMRGG
jgi:hypothetical protein